MWYNIFKFEIQYRIKRPETYIFFLFLFLFSIAGVDFIFQGEELGILKKNAPIVIAKTMGAITGIFMILTSMIMGVAVLRDFEYGIESLMFSTPIEKKDYLMGRFLGAFAVLLFVFSGVLLGMCLAEFMPWQNPKNYHVFNIFSYVKPFLCITLPILFTGAALFFISGALSRKLVVVYTQGIVFFVIFMLTKSITNVTLQAVLDPFSLTTLSLATDSWSAIEKSTQSIPLLGIVFYNKLFWMLIGLSILIYGFKKFNFNVIKNKRFKSQDQLVTNVGANSNRNDIVIPFTELQHGFRSKWIQLKYMSWFYFINMFKQPSFWAIVICGMIIILINSVSLGTVYGVDSYPATYFIVEELQETSIYFFMILLVFYSGELIWKERSVKINLIYDATPMSNFINISSKFIGLNLIYIILMFALIISGIIFQTINGYYNYEFKVYFFGFFLEVLPFLSLYTFMAFFIQALINNKFVGIMMVIMFFILTIILNVFGFDHVLYAFGGNSLGSYSDMNGYGHLLKPYLIIKSYWLVFGILLLIFASLISVRGTETRFLKRLKLSKQRLSKPLIKFGSVIILVFVILGSFIFYNTNIVNTYWTDTDAKNFRVSYENTLKRFEYLPQPKIIDVNLKVELYPSTRTYTVEGYYMLKNTCNISIESIHIQKLIESNISLDNLTFEAKVSADSTYNNFDYMIYELEEKLQPGDSVKMNFKQRFITKGFEAENSNRNINVNGTFFNNKDLPTLGYNRKYELQDDEERATYNLKPRPNRASRNHANELQNARSGGDSDGLQLEIIVGTEKDQVAIVPGNLLKTWANDDRNYYHYKTDQPIINFYATVSARYELKKEVWLSSLDNLTDSIDLEIYYHKTHDYNIDRMMKSMKASLEYFSANFSPYQYDHLRIMEFPRYAQFAQSFPGTVPFSESIGFVLQIDDETDVDMAFYITAHEIAHQWFGMQIEAANVKGQHFILETLSQYAAMMVLKQEFSEAKVLEFLELQKDVYKKERQREESREPSLALVENQDYIYYAKGAVQMYEFQKKVGADKVNFALKRFLEDWNTKNGRLKIKTERYATSKDLLAYFRAVTPEEHKHIVRDLFETVD